VHYAFVTVGPFSGTNARVQPLLAAAFDELDERALDLPAWVRGSKPLLAANLAAVVREFGVRPLRDREHLWGVFYKTAFLQRRLRRELARDAGDCRFTFQTQSLFDASLPGVPHFIYTDHTALANSYYPDYDPASRPPEHWLEVERSIYERADRVFCMGTHVTRSVTEHYGIDPARVLTVRAGANVEAADQPHGSYDGKHVVFIGRDWERKGGPDLVRAFALVREQHPDARLTIAGCEPDVGGAPGVTVRGNLPAAEISALYRDATVFCMPTLAEPLGIVFVEALAHAVPAVATRLGGVPDIVEDGRSGVLVEPHDVDAIAAALSRLIGDPDTCRTYGEAGRAFVRDRFTWPVVVETMAAEIRSIAGAA
jgi:glycosyltransferase involved in cell wall biosynthesis